MRLKFCMQLDLLHTVRLIERNELMYFGRRGAADVMLAQRFNKQVEILLRNAVQILKEPVKQRTHHFFRHSSIVCLAFVRGAENDVLLVVIGAVAPQEAQLTQVLGVLRSVVRAMRMASA